MHQFSFAASKVIEALIIVHVRQNVRLWLKHQTFFILTLNKMWVLRQLKNTIPTWACGVCEFAYGIKRLFCNVKLIETNMNFKPRIPIRLDTGKISLILVQKIVELYWLKLNIHTTRLLCDLFLILHTYLQPALVWKICHWLVILNVSLVEITTIYKRRISRTTF